MQSPQSRQSLQSLQSSSITGVHWMQSPQSSQSLQSLQSRQSLQSSTHSRHSAPVSVEPATCIPILLKAVMLPSLFFYGSFGLHIEGLTVGCASLNYTLLMVSQKYLRSSLKLRILHNRYSYKYRLSTHLLPGSYLAYWRNSICCSYL